MAYRVSVSVKRLTSCFAALVLAGCVEQGFSNRDDELTRVRANTGPFSVVSANHERAVVSARGRQVAIEAAEGFCLARESIETSGRSAFAMIGDCVLDDPAATASLPRGVPGIITVSISGDRGYSRNGDGAGSLKDLSSFLDTAEGLSLLGRGGPGSSVKVLDQKTIGDGLYVLVEDQNTDLVPILAPKFWRSFVDLNDRLTVVTISSFRDKPLGNDQMLKYLVTQVKTLSRANVVPLNEPQTLIAAADTRPEREPSPVQSLTDLQPQLLAVTTETQQEDVYSPVPPSRPQVEAPTATAEADGDVIEAPNEADPAVELEIAAASETIPVPAPAPRQNETAPPAEPGAAEVASTEAATPPVEPAPQGTPVGDLATNTPELPTETAEKPAEVEVAAEATPEAAATPEVAAAEAAAGLDTVPVPTPAPQETTAAVESTEEPKPDTTPTANAPQNAPEAPKRPRRG